jgi:hypothetical protein
MTRARQGQSIEKCLRLTYMCECHLEREPLEFGREQSSPAGRWQAHSDLDAVDTWRRRPWKELRWARPGWLGKRRGGRRPGERLVCCEKTTSFSSKGGKSFRKDPCCEQRTRIVFSEPETRRYAQHTRFMLEID